MNRNITLQSASDWLNGHGIMSILTANYTVPWAGVIDGQTLDDDYYGNRSGTKIIAPLAQKFLTEQGLTDERLTRLARVIYAKFGDNWQRAFDALAVEYEPLENYRMVEEETPAETTETETPAHIKVTDTPAETTTTETPAEVTTTDTPAETTTTDTPAETKKVAEREFEGLNSTDYEDADKTTETYTTQHPETIKNETDTAGTTKLEVDTAGSTKVEVDTAGTVETETITAGTKKYTTQKKRELKRSGNIGVTTSQQMLESEIKLRQMYTLMDSLVFPNVDSVMCLSIFGDEETLLDDFNIVTDYVLPIASASRLGGVKIGNGITISSDGTISVATGDYITAEELAQTLNSYVTVTALTNQLQNYATNAALSEGLATKQALLISGTNIKTINGESILGSGDIEIQGGGSSNYNAPFSYNYSITAEVTQ